MTDKLTIRSVQTGACREMKGGNQDDPSQRDWTSAIIKTPVPRPVPVHSLGLDGDEQADLKHHGGVDKAVLAYCEDHYDIWRTEFPGVDWSGGAFGENLTLTGLLETDVCVGDVFECELDERDQTGGFRLQITQPREPCWKLSERWGLPKLAVRVQKTRRTGWYMRVLKEGVVNAGQTLRLVERPHPEFTIQVANDILFAKPRDAVEDRRLAACEALSDAWKENLTQRSRSREA